MRLLEASCTFEVSENGNLIVSGEQGAPDQATGSLPGGLWLDLGCRLSPALTQALLPPPPTGKVYQWEDPDPKLFDNRYGIDPATPTDPTDPTTAIRLSRGDVYKELQLRGYNYGPCFQGVLETSSKGRCTGGPTLCFGANSCCLV